MLDDAALLDLLASAAVAQADIPNAVAGALMSARMVALLKPDRSFRGIATSCAVRPRGEISR